MVGTGLVGLVAVPDASAAVPPLRPFVDCIQPKPEAAAGIYLVYFGYESDAQRMLEFGDANQIVPGLGYQGQPTIFNGGYYPRVFAAIFNANAFPAIHWSVDGQEAIATTDSRRCAAGLTAPASDLTRTGATLNGVVVPGGATTTYTFEYGTTPSYGETTPAREVTGTGAQLVQAELTGLAPGTRYHFRLSATDAAGTTTGAELAFTTPAPELMISNESLAPARVNRWYAASLTAVGGEGPYRWRKVSGWLPPGLTFHQRTGRIVGVPTRATTTSITVKVIDSNGTTATRTLSITSYRP
ncbi:MULTISPECIES: putative Ig domain-containing protein [unclassified Micromonospora]|uniref:putative Ig domain-containing protein n=1 Tax=unclassified Micromonospora TaxID=2617518 RepID=UPI00362CDF27